MVTLYYTPSANTFPVVFTDKNETWYDYETYFKDVLLLFMVSHKGHGFVRPLLLMETEMRKKNHHLIPES